MDTAPNPAPAAIDTRSPYNHFNCHGRGRCNSSLPLTLADKELITGRIATRGENPDGTEFCGDCLEDLPVGFAALFHVCPES